MKNLLYEDDVVAAVCRHLESQGWVIESRALASQHGDDIVAFQDGRRLIVEAKGEGSSKHGTNRYGQVFTGNQVRTHVSVAVTRAMRVWSAGQAEAAVAFPDNEHHRVQVSLLERALKELGITVFWVARDSGVSVNGDLTPQ